MHSQTWGLTPFPGSVVRKRPQRTQSRVKAEARARGVPGRCLDRRRHTPGNKLPVYTAVAVIGAVGAYVSVLRVSIPQPRLLPILETTPGATGSKVVVVYPLDVGWGRAVLDARGGRAECKSCQDSQSDDREHGEWWPSGYCM